MFGRRKLAARCAALASLATTIAVASCDVDPGADIALDMKAPAGVLDQATNVKLSVFDAKGKQCDASGSPGDVPSTAKIFQLKQDGCDPGTWCTSIKLAEDGSTRMFAVEVSNASGLLAQGCTTAKIDQDPLSVPIKVVRYVPPACCNNGALETGELCDNGMAAGDACTSIMSDEICASDCTTNEVAVDRPLGGSSPAVGTKSSLAMAFAGGAGDLNQGLHTAYSDTAVASNPDIDVRYLKSDLTSISNPAVLQAPLKLPLKCNNVGGAGAARNQNSPSIAPINGDSVLIAYLSDELVPAKFNMFATVLGPSGCTDGSAFQVNSTLDGVSDPDVAAGPSGGALFVWAQNGSVFARLFDGTAPSGADIPLGAGSTPHVAGSNGGYVIAYHGAGAGDDDGIFTVTVSATGQVGSPVLVNAKTTGTQDQPDVAALPDGRYAVAFHSDGDVFMQRYDASGAAVAGDQDAPLNTTTDGEQSSPSVAAGTSPSAGDFFAVAWQSDSGDIYGRLAGGSSGYLFNAIDGQNSDFVANIPGEVGTRAHPALAIGGGGYLVIGWEDTSTVHPGVFVRRFPLPE